MEASRSPEFLRIRPEARLWMALRQALHKAKHWMVSYAAPEGSGRRRVLRASKRLVRAWVRRPARGTRPPTGELDVYDRRSLARFLKQCGAAELKWSRRAAGKDCLGAARLVLGLLQARPDLRRRFPR